MDDLIVKRYMLIPADRFCYDRGNLVVDFDWNAREIVNRLTDMAPDVLIEAVRTIQLSRSPFVFTDSSKNEVVYNQGEDDEITFSLVSYLYSFFRYVCQKSKVSEKVIFEKIWPDGTNPKKSLYNAINSINGLLGENNIDWRIREEQKIVELRHEEGVCDRERQKRGSAAS